MEIDGFAYLLLEYAENGNLFTYLNKHEIDNETLCRIFVEVCLAVEFMHNNGYIHRDIKPENILLTANLSVLLADFGWCSALKDVAYRFKSAGTYEYMSPEAIRSEIQSEKSDIWALGILLYELYHKQEPFSGKDSKEVYESIKNKQVEFFNDVPEESIDLIISILAIEEEKRPSIREILNHPFVKKFYKSQIPTEPSKCNRVNVIVKVNTKKSDTESLGQVHFNKTNWSSNSNLRSGNGSSSPQKISPINTGNFGNFGNFGTDNKPNRLEDQYSASKSPIRRLDELSQVSRNHYQKTFTSEISSNISSENNSYHEKRFGVKEQTYQLPASPLKQDSTDDSFSNSNFRLKSFKRTGTEEFNVRKNSHWVDEGKEERRSELRGTPVQKNSFQLKPIGVEAFPVVESSPLRMQHNQTLNSRERVVIRSAAQSDKMRFSPIREQNPMSRVQLSNETVQKYHQNTPINSYSHQNIIYTPSPATKKYTQSQSPEFVGETR